MDYITKINELIKNIDNEKKLATFYKYILINTGDDIDILPRFIPFTNTFKRLIEKEDETTIRTFLDSLRDENHMVDGEKTFIPFSKVKTGSNLNKITPKWMKSSLVTSLVDFDDNSDKGSQVGKGELLLTYILEGGYKPAKGDVGYGDTIIECKTEGGKILKNLAPYKESLKDLMQELQTMLKPLNEAKEGNVHIVDLDRALDILKKEGYNQISKYFQAYQMTATFGLAPKNSKTAIDLMKKNKASFSRIHKNIKKLLAVIKTNYIKVHRNSIDVMKAMSFFEQLFKVLDSFDSGATDYEKQLEFAKLFFIADDLETTDFRNKHFIAFQKIVNDYLDNEPESTLSKTEVKDELRVFLNSKVSKSNAVVYLMFRPSGLQTWDFIIDGIYDLYKDNAAVVVEDLFNSMIVSILTESAIKFNAANYPIDSHVSPRFKEDYASTIITGRKIDLNALYKVLAYNAFKAYKEKDKWDYLMLINKDTKEYKIYVTPNKFMNDTSNVFDIRINAGAGQPPELVVTNFKF